MIPVDPNVLIPATLVAIPATIGAWAALRNGRQLHTNHGKTIGRHVEDLGDDLGDLSRAFARHEADDARRFDQIIASQEETRQNTRDRAQEITDAVRKNDQS